MKKDTAYILQVIVLLVLSGSLALANGRTITILHVNDTHSHLDAFGPKDSQLDGTLGGIAKAATVINRVRASNSDVMLLHAGDVFHGDFFFNKFFGVPEFQLMKQIGFDAMAVGNHEFDFGPDALASSLVAAFGTPANGFPVLAANLKFPTDPAIPLENWVRSGVVLEKGGVKFGIFGMTVPGDPTTQPAPVVVRDDIVNVANGVIASLKAQGAEVIICLSHLGILYDRALAANTAGIDFIIGGHDQIVLRQPTAVTNSAGARTLIFQAGEFYKLIGKLTISVENGKASFVSYRLIPIDATVKEDTGIQTIVEGLKAEIEQQYGDVYHKVLGVAVHDLTRLYDPASPVRDTPLGDLVTDACRTKEKTDIAIAAVGFISEQIYAGAIVGADVFRSLSYGFDPATGLGFKLAKVQMSGSDIITGIEASLSYLGLSDDFFLFVSGMKYKYDATKPVGSRVLLKSVKIDGKPIDLEKNYTVTVNEGIAALLAQMAPNATVLEISPDFEYIVVRDYIQRLGRVDYKAEKRIVDVSVHRGHGSPEETQLQELAKPEADPPGSVIREFQLAQNYPNPFNPSTTISYALPANVHATLKIYNVLGEEIATLVDQEMSMGEHQARWDASAIPSGVYLYRLVAGELSATKKLCLTK